MDLQSSTPFYQVLHHVFSRYLKYVCRIFGSNVRMYAQGKECIAKAMSNFLKGFRIEIVKLYPSHKCGQ